MSQNPNVTAIEPTIEQSAGAPPPKFVSGMMQGKDDATLTPSEPKELEAVKEETEKPYSIYAPAEKWFILSMASLAGLFSPLAANMYLPAIPTIAAAFDKSGELINLTVTVYMVFQAASSMLWGPLADRVGRRPILLACLLVLSAACIGLALIPTSDYWLLMLLRCVQAAGSASTIALGAGIIGDIGTRAERGAHFALFTLGPQFGPTFGPVVGGALAQTIGWRWMFWLLCILSMAYFLAMLTFLPETLRRLVGDGSTIPSRIHRPLIPLVGAGRQKMQTEIPPPPPFSNPLMVLTYPDVINLLIFNGILSSILYSVTTTISTLFHATYPFLNETDVGLCYMAIGGGVIVGVLFTGRLLDRDYRRMKEKIARDTPTDVENPIPPDQGAKHENFPIEKARLLMMPWYLLVYSVCVAGYGWSLQKRANIAVPLVLQILLAATGIAMGNTLQTLLIDLMPTQGSSVSACNNIVRCGLGAAMVAVIDLMLKALGMGWTYILLAGLSIATALMIRMALWLGPRCRAKRNVRYNSLRTG